MKKGWLIINLIVLVSILFACQDLGVLPQEKKHTHQIYAMDTSINLQLLNIAESDAKIHFEFMDNLYEKYSVLADNFIPYNGVNNLYRINKLAEAATDYIKIDIEKELYDLLVYANDLKVRTNGYFDITIGKTIDIWKTLINEFETESIPLEEVDRVLKLIDELPEIKDPITLSSEDNKYYITIKNGVKLDLGAIAKGYVTQLAIDYLHSFNIVNYSLNAGSSSMVLGEKVGEAKDFIIGLSNPLYTDNPTEEPAIYGKLTFKNASITTSGSNLQKAVDVNGSWYHHIISPKTKRPANYYYAISIVGQDAGLLDAYSTAFFSMSVEEITQMVKDTDLEVIIFNKDETYTVINETNRFEPTRLKP